MMNYAKALIVEDEPVVGFMLEDMLVELGFSEVDLITTLDGARDYLRSAAADVAILDVNVHGERSYALIDELAAKQIPFIFATGYGDAEHPESLVGTPTITKPYSMSELRNALCSVLPLATVLGGSRD